MAPELQVMLLRAAKEGDFETISSLLDTGAQVDICDESGNTALHFAIANAQDESGSRKKPSTSRKNFIEDI